MEACLEMNGLHADNPNPAWGMRVARCVGDGFGMGEELRGVPKAALQTVFGKALGRRIWAQSRFQTAPAVAPKALRVADGEISVGMAAYVGERAAHALRERSRQAKAIGLTITYANGESRVVQTRLVRPTDEARELARAATDLLRRLPSQGVQSIDLKVTSVESAAVQERADGLGCSLMGAAAHA